MTEDCVYCEYLRLCEEGIGPLICPYGVMEEENECCDDW